MTNSELVIRILRWKVVGRLALLIALSCFCLCRVVQLVDLFSSTFSTYTRGIKFSPIFNQAEFCIIAIMLFLFGLAYVRMLQLRNRMV